MPTGFWLDFMVFMTVVIFLVAVIPAILRRRMGADRKKWFSYNHINECHKKGDWTLRIVYIFALIASVILFADKPLIVFLISYFLLISQLGFQTYVEWRFSANRKSYKVSLIELSLFLVALIVMLLWV